MNTPDPEQFAKIVLWHLATMKTDVALLTAQVRILEVRLGRVPSDKEQKEWRKQRIKKQLQLFRESCQKAGLASQDPPELPSERGMQNN